MHIRPFTPADREDCIAAFKSNMPGFFAPDELVDFEGWLEEVVKPKVLKEQYFVVELNNKVIGCGGYAIDAAERSARMTWGLVHNSLHKKGIGRALLLHRIKEIRAVSSQCIIGLDTTQHSYSFFEKLGFVTTKITKDSYGPGLDRYDMELNPA